MTTAAGNSTLPNLINMVCQCGYQFDQHRRYRDWTPPEPEPTYTLDQVQRARTGALSHTLPSWLWDDVESRLRAIQQ